MTTPHWLQRLHSILTRSRSGRSRHRAFRRPSARPSLEAMEDRCVPSAGALDFTFGNGGTVTTSLGTDDDEGGRIFALPGGKVLVVGYTDLGTNDSNGVLALLRYNADGTLDSTYENGAKPNVPGIFQPSLANPVAVGPEGQVAILEGGTLWQFNPDGSLDTAFQGGSVSPGIGQVVAFDGDRIVICGRIAGFQAVLERYNTDGTLDTSFGANGSGMRMIPWLLPNNDGFVETISALAVQPDGAILVGGGTDDFLQILGRSQFYPFLERFTPTGALDTTFGPDQRGTEIILPGDNFIVDNLAGWSPPPAPQNIVLLTGVDHHVLFDGGNGAAPYQIAFTPDGKFLTAISTVYNTTLAQFNSDGSVDTAYLTPSYNYGGPIGGAPFSIQGDGKVIILTATTDPVSGNPYASAFRYNADGSPDLGFGPYGNATAEIAIADANTGVNDLAVDSNGNIVAVGTVYDPMKTVSIPQPGGIGGWDITLTRLIGNTFSYSGVQTALVSQPPVNPATGNPTVTLQATTQTQANDFLALFQNASTPGFTPLAPPAGATTPMDISLTLALGISLNEAALSIPQGIRVQINGGTWYGGSPALTLSSGNLTITGATFLNATDAPTILVTGGSLTLRNDIIQESTGYADPAISLTGGMVDLGTATDPGGNTINVNGTGTFIRNTTANPVTAVGDTLEVNCQAVTWPVPVTVTTSSSLMLIGNNPPPLTGSVNGTPVTGTTLFTTSFGDTVSVTLGTAATSASPVGQFAITATFSGPDAGNYVINPATSTVGTMYVVSLGADPSSTTGAKSVVFWDNKGNAKLITAADLSSLDALNLVTQGGSAFDPKSVAQLQAWLSISPNATAAYQLAVQLAAMDLNVLTGYVKVTDLVYAGALLPYATADAITGLSSGGFISIQNLLSAANAVLSQVNPGTPSGDPNQAYELVLAQALQTANGNGDFVSQELLWGLVGLYPTLV